MESPNSHLTNFNYLLEDDASQALSQKQTKSWLLSYLDLMTLLLVLFVALISKATLDPYSKNRAVAAQEPPKKMEEQSFSLKSPQNNTSFDDLSQHSLLLALEKRIREDHDSNIRVKFFKKNVIITMPELLLFKKGDVKIQTEGYRFLQKIAPILKEINGSFQVEGHADSDPIHSLKFPSNWELSAARAASVAHYLEEMGVDRTKLAAIGYSDSQPAHSNKTEAGKRKNRRVIINVKIN